MYGEWYPDLEEFQLGDLPPQSRVRWTLSGLTYPLSIHVSETETLDFRVYSVPSTIKGGVRFKVWVDPPLASSIPNSSDERMSPAQQRLADLLKLDKAATLKFMREVFKLSKEVDGVRLGEITAAVKSHLQESDEEPTPEIIFERLCMADVESFLQKIEAKPAGTMSGSDKYPPAQERMTPSIQKMAQVLGTNKAGTEAFIESVLKLRQRRDQIGIADILLVVEQRGRLGLPVTVALVYEQLKKQASQRKENGAVITKVAKDKTKRKHVSVWEIRN